ncbi:MAG: hypothetical protein AAFY41_13895 [Bacteroidota bacterium]
MKITTLLFMLTWLVNQAISQETNIKDWEVGISFGEIPILAGSFKPGLSVGYHFNEYLYLGGIYQIVDNIQRNDKSFDAKSLGFTNLQSSKERVAPRAILHARVRPHKRAPFISFGIVSNGEDEETAIFGDGINQIGNGSYDGPVTVKTKRKAAIRPALGVGYHYDFKNGITVSTEWTFNWFNPVPEPELEFITDYEIEADDLAIKTSEIVYDFQDNFHNRYHIFHLGVGYKF